MELSNQHYLDHWKQDSFDEYCDPPKKIIGVDPETNDLIAEGDCCFIPHYYPLPAGAALPDEHYEDIPF
ncbi:hypothetical protein F7734_55820 [Scytonema sp. UIC 10036]|uniref:hypothetical protein n=1 Tax=Scytonema sp. UIC 10036 TaxID=2304196 RepID=UPI0012DA5CD5|nr:hypothetical protein [Scytonema sp. UIC 10036]MUH01049.1 hypothetical protein [Scytonema sp. UIC 10036]